VSRVVAVSNRVALPKRGAAPGGLTVGLMAAMKSRGGLWFGWSGETGESATAVKLARRGGVTFATVNLTEMELQQHYHGFCNGTLWPLFHYFLDGFRYFDEQYEAYLSVNRRFARELLPQLQADDVVWVHDYHLLPLAQQLRLVGADQPIGLFLHIPFPHLESLRVLPVHVDLLRAMLEYDLIGFQTERDLSAFCTAVTQLWGPDCVQADGSILLGTRRVQTGCFPIGVSVDGIRVEAESCEATDSCQRLIAGLLGKKLIMGVDRLDYSKGLVERFRAYERFLESNPASQNRVSFIQIAPLSRSDVHAYTAIRRELEQTAGRINGRFADTDWTPIRYLNRNFPHDVLMAFMRNAQVGLVTPLRDGMNLVAKEFVAAQRPEDPGVLVLSNLAGAALELSAALQVNPYDCNGVALAIEQALNMPLAERRERHQAMLGPLRRNDIDAWHTRFLDCLRAAARWRGRETIQ
jgi:trehalose 6-phosphate synthase